VVLGLVVLAVHRLLPALFTSDPAVRSALAAALVVVALGQPLSGYVFVVDGVLIGAGDGAWLARAMAATLVLYAPFALAVHVAGDDLLARGAPTAVAVLWVAFTVFMGIRALFFRHRVRGDAWAVTGAAR
jgi:Na+-driven multidrug efflux pump